MKQITVNASRRYEIRIGSGLLDCCGTAIAEAAGGQTAVVVSDDHVAPLYLERVRTSMQKAGYRVLCHVIEHGEASKDAAHYIALVEFLAASRLTRSDVLVALGGGVVGDLTGFAAATYLRGIAYVQIPTSLLAMVDSSVGGKTAIDLSAGKNLLGSFYQPSLVLCDPDLLSTLPPLFFSDGCAEIVKYGMIADADLFATLERDGMSNPEEVIARCVTIKRDIVEEDEHDCSIRQLLNFGHTVGHAIEAESQFTISHGHAVAMGMAAVTRAAAARGMCDRGIIDRLEGLLAVFSLPDALPYPIATLCSAMCSDKKRSGDRITLIVPECVGRCIPHTLPIDELSAFLTE